MATTPTVPAKPVKDVLPPASAFYVPSLPTLEYPLGLHPTHPLVVHAGLLPSDPGEAEGGGEGSTGRGSEIFFLYLQPRRMTGKRRLIFWFNGGPGCSSFDGALLENGPFRPNSDGTLRLQMEGGWEEFAAVVYIDQPPGTGFSYSNGNGYLHELTQAAAHFSHFLENWLTVFPEWRGVETYLTGESYAGQYIPYFAHSLLNLPTSSPLYNFPLKGIAIGNGWIDPREQYPGYVDFAKLHGLVKSGTKQWDALEQAMASCQLEIEKWNTSEKEESIPINMRDCGNVMGEVMTPFYREIDGRPVCMNVYDIRLTDDSPACGMNWPSELPQVYEYLHRKDVVDALHAGKRQAAWTECDGNTGGNLKNYHSFASVKYLAEILEQGVKVMLFAGDQDLVCNHVGIERLIDRLEWSGEQGFGNATAKDWSLNDTAVGEWTTARNLTYVKVFQSSHMVPYDLPNVAHDMMIRFMDVDFSEMVDGTPSWPSKIGEDDDFVTVGKMASGSSTSDDVISSPKTGSSSTDWEAFYNAGSAFVILVFLLTAVGLFFFFRNRRARALASSRGAALPLSVRDTMDSEAEDRIPLRSSAERPFTPPRGHRGHTGTGSGSSVNYSPRLNKGALWSPAKPNAGSGTSRGKKTGHLNAEEEEGNLAAAQFELGEEDE